MNEFFSCLAGLVFGMFLGWLWTTLSWHEDCNKIGMHVSGSVYECKKK